MTTTSVALPVEPKRDRYGRYLAPHPVTGKQQAWTRVTTLADTLDDRYNLEQWKVRTAALGLVARPDLLALVAAQHDNKNELNKIMEKALEAGKASEGANMGTALHKACERADLGEAIVMPGAGAADLDAYRKLRADTGAKIHTLPDGRPGIEVIVLIPDLNCAGTFDRLLELPGELLPVVDDIKTGASAIEWAMTSIAIQLACYAHGTHIFDPATNLLTPMPRVNLDKAFVTHLPAGRAQAAMWEVDIAAGWEAAQHAMWVREWRTKRDKLARHATAVSVALAPSVAPVDPFDGLPTVEGEGEAPRKTPVAPSAATQVASAPSRPEPSVDPFADFVSAPAPATAVSVAGNARAGAPAAPPATDPFADFVSSTSAGPAVDVRLPRQIRFDNLKGRLSTLKGIDGAAERMAMLWPEGMPGIANPHFDPLDDDLDRIEGVLNEVEKQFGAPFDPPPSPPAEIPPPVERPPAPPMLDEGAMLDDVDLAALKARVDGLKPERQAWLAGVVKQCGAARRPVNLRDVPSTRRFGIVRALLCAALVDPPIGDTVLDLAARVVIGTDGTESLGELIGSLSTEQAGRLADLVCAIDRTEIKVMSAILCGVKGAAGCITDLMLAGDLSPYKPQTQGVPTP